MDDSDDKHVEGARKKTTERDREPAPRTGGTSFLRGVTLRDILRTHELLRRCRWEHLFESRRP